MKAKSRSNALLVELLIVIMFFMLAAAFLMQMFSAAHTQGEKAGMLNAAMVEAQNIAEKLYASENVENTLSEMGFESEENIWRRVYADMTAEVETSVDATPTGRMSYETVRILKDAEQVIELPVARYIAGDDLADQSINGSFDADSGSEEVQP